MRHLCIPRWATRAFAALVVATSSTACDNLLEVENPGAILETSLNNPAVIPLLVNSVVGSFQSMYADLAYYSAVFTDEVVTGHNFDTIIQIDLRIMDEANGTINADIYQPLQTARFQADSAAVRLRTLVPNANQDLRLARVLAYSGYTYTLLGEFFCEAPINLSPSKSTAELLRTAVGRFQEAIQVANAARGAGARPASVDSIVNLARVGAARASLQLGNKAEAVQFASGVPASFRFDIQHSENSPAQYNPFYGASTGSNQNLGVGPEFRNLNDRRVRHTARGILGHNRSTILFRPYQSPSFSGFNPADTAGFERSTDLRLASGLEAAYIVAEAQGPTSATLAFVNQRRAFGGQTALVATPSGAEIMAALREQRSRDFFLDGHRLGDLRRYKAQGIGDFFPKGAHPNPSFGDYGTATCFVVPLAERIGNPNV